MFDSFQKRTLSILSVVLSLRMLGISMVFPIFAIYAREFTSSPLLMGLAFSGYALTQAIFQIPFGYLSDRFGRLKIIVLGMLIFSAGSILAAYPPNIFWLIVARLLQGCGAITSTVIAFIGDVFPYDVRSRAMAIIGISFSLSFSLGMPLGTFIAGNKDISFIFLLTGTLAFIAAILAGLFIKEHKGHPRERVRFKNLFRDRNLIKIDLAGVIANFNLLSMFFVLPIVLSRYLVIEHYWRVMLPMVLLGMIVSYSTAHIADKGYRKEMGILGPFLFILGGVMLTEIHTIDSVVLVFFIFSVIFSGFSILEAILPSMLTRLSGKSSMGTASGIYNMMQFTGSFLGGVGGSVLYFKNTFLFGVVVALISFVGLLLLASIRKSAIDNI